MRPIITALKLRETDIMGDDGFFAVESILLTLDPGGIVSVDPDATGLETMLRRTGAVFADKVACDDDEADWLEWALGVAADIVTPDTDTGADNDTGAADNVLDWESGTMAELEGDIAGTDDEEVIESEVGEGAEVEVETGGTTIEDEPEKPVLKRAGCKKPWEVKGWEDGKLLSVVKRHKGQWGRCEYRVLCLPLGRYRLVYFMGNRSDLTVNTEWDDAASMFRALLAQGAEKTRYDGRGKRQGTRMTINQFFGKRNRKRKATTGDVDVAAES